LYLRHTEKDAGWRQALRLLGLRRLARGFAGDVTGNVSTLLLLPSRYRAIPNTAKRCKYCTRQAAESLDPPGGV